MLLPLPPQTHPHRPQTQRPHARTQPQHNHQGYYSATATIRIATQVVLMDDVHDDDAVLFPFYHLKTYASSSKRNKSSVPETMPLYSVNN